MIAFLALSLFYVLFVVVEAFYQAVKIKTTVLRAYNRWYFYTAIVLFHFVIAASIVQLDLIPIKLYKIPSPSMAPTLVAGDYFVADKIYYNRRALRRGDIVVFRSPVDASMDFIKRVVGLPGETGQIVRNKVFIDMIVLDESYINFVGLQIKRSNLYTKKNFGPLKIPNNNVFVLGDNRSESYDSRHYKFVPLSDLRGKALYIVWARDNQRLGRQIR